MSKDEFKIQIIPPSKNVYKRKIIIEKYIVDNLNINDSNNVFPFLNPIRVSRFQEYDDPKTIFESIDLSVSCENIKIHINVDEKFFTKSSPKSKRNTVLKNKKNKKKNNAKGVNKKR